MLILSEIRDRLDSYFKTTSLQFTHAPAYQLHINISAFPRAKYKSYRHPPSQAIQAVPHHLLASVGVGLHVDTFSPSVNRLSPSVPSASLSPAGSVPTNALKL